MKVVIAPDSFKDCFSACTACEIISEAICQLDPDTECVCKPLADGGEGTAESVMKAVGGDWIACTVDGPQKEKRVDAGFVWFPDTRTALVEMASASGLHHVDPDQRNPMKTTSKGTGQLLRAAAEHGAQKVFLAVGGSATVDLGTGMATALGWRFLNHEGQPIEPTGGNLLKIKTITPPETPWDIPVEVLCDVRSPLLGYTGSARVYGPQKGASRSDVVLLEVGLTHVSNLLLDQFAIDLQGIPFGGAAGGLAAGAAAFLRGKLVSGVETVIAMCGLLDELKTADWIITGEGRLDIQSLHGKVVSGILKHTRGTNARVAVLAGQVDLSEEQYRSCGMDYVRAAKPVDLSLAKALKNGPALLSEIASQWARDHLKARV